MNHQQYIASKKGGLSIRGGNYFREHICKVDESIERRIIGKE
jgi:hypothetical protein